MDEMLSVQRIWLVGLVVTLVVWVPLAVYALHRTLNAALAIRRYAREALAAAGGIAANTAPVAALETTIAVATDMVGRAAAIEEKLGTIADVIEARTS